MEQRRSQLTIAEVTGSDSGSVTCCSSDPTCCSPASEAGPQDTAAPTIGRRGFLGLSAVAAAGAGLLLPADAVAVSPDKGIDPDQLRALRRGGEPTRYRGEALTRIGMPVGGATCGQVYLSGDGRLWLWDVLHPDAPDYGGTDWTGVHYTDPIDLDAPFRTGFAIRITDADGGRSVPLDGIGFDQTSFVGRYPVGEIALRSSTLPISVDLQSFSPFIPGDLDSSSLPVTIMEYTLHNDSGRPVHCRIAGLAENPVCLRSRTSQPVTLAADTMHSGGVDGVQFTATPEPVDDPLPGDVIFEDWSGEDFAGWTVSGTAFGDGPVDISDLPASMLRFGPLGSTGDRLVSSYPAHSDAATGSLTSAPFTIEHETISTRIGGGRRGVSIAVLIDDHPVATASGWSTEPLRPVLLDVSGHRGKTARIKISDDNDVAWGHLTVDRILFTDRPAPEPDRVLADWESGNYDGWTSTGDAFGAGPVPRSPLPDYFPAPDAMNTEGNFFVSSHDFRNHDDAGAADKVTGTLIGEPFTIDRRYLAAQIGGGADANTVGLRLVVDDTVVARLAGSNDEAFTPLAVDVSAYHGSTGHLEIVDDNSGGWGHVNVDAIWLTDLPLRIIEADQLTDNGSFAIGVINPGRELDVRVTPSAERWQQIDDQLDPRPGDTDGGRQAGVLTVDVSLPPHGSRTVRFAYGWRFPTPNRRLFGFLEDFDQLSHHYAARFDDAAAALDRLATDWDRLTDTTRTFVRTWYQDSTLPQWLLERTLAPASTVATETAQRFSNGRFYAWEGTYCCAGTCTHVWNYAQSIGYLFGELERDARSRTDFGSAFHPDGSIDYRGEADRRVAHDGQCGNILRTYREHQLTSDNDFLTPIWPRVKKAMQYLIAFDRSATEGTEGILEGAQYNTLDATWYGEIPWISGLYVAALRACAEMADDMADADFADGCRRLADSGSAYLHDHLWNDRYRYFEQRVDPDHADAINSNRGCYLDQMFGQTYAHQLGLPRVFERSRSLTALKSLYRNNFMSDPPSYAETSGIPGGRAFAEQRDSGTLVCTWPYGGADTAPGSGEPYAIGYFNEVWTGMEYQFASHLLSEGMVDEGLIVLHAIHERYRAEYRNPYNEIECSDHYARAMMAHSAYLAAIGFGYHGSRGELSFDPKINPDDFRAAFTVADGWGTFSQRDNNDYRASITIRHGRLIGLRRLTLRPAAIEGGRRAQVRDAEGRPVRSTSRTTDDSRLQISLARPVTLQAGETLKINYRS
ncbi:GH116 family glycosyl hydrolase [Microlunatus soli]|uniref:Beta-Glucocerebrosidase 2 N terminal n=1 Tax=Microlunatus soli TaxID=630515 RepID=A0A1H1Q9Y9_9ACTN|nr:GH116 family glycosyl hydrolase [Microlunatus soli]SDS20123.1 beta-Glucocerebrosidase 2 N terminal [Microlunatus soli]